MMTAQHTFESYTDKLQEGHSINVQTLAVSSRSYALCDPVTLTFGPNINWWARIRDVASLVIV